MALKNLKVTVTHRTKLPGQEPGPPVIAEYYIPATLLLARIHAATPETGGGGAGEAGPHEIADGKAASWCDTATKMRGPIAQSFKLGGATVLKAKDSYYMTVAGINTPGVTESGGPTYNEFRALIAACGTDKAVAATMLGVLGAPGTAVFEEASAVAALMGAMFLAEPRRNKRAMVINAMLLDLIATGTGYGSKGKIFDWNKVLWRDPYPTASTTKDYTFSGGAEALRANQRGGKLPMSNTGAVEQSTQPIPATPPNGNAFHFPNAEMDKEGTIAVRWLMHRLTKKFPPTTWFEHVTKGTPTWAAKEAPVLSTMRYKMAFTGVGAGAHAYLTAAGAPVYEKTVLDAIDTVLAQRMTAFGTNPLA